MAYIHDYTYNEDAVNVSSHTANLPNYDSGDLLVWIVHKDTKTGSNLSLPSGWASLYRGESSNNEVLICYKTASSSESNPTTSSSDTDAYQSTLISFKGASSIGGLNKTNADLSDGIATVSWYNDSSLGKYDIKMAFLSTSSTGGPSIENFGERIVNEEGSAVSMVVHGKLILDTTYSNDFNLLSSASLNSTLFQFTVYDDGNNLNTGTVEIPLTTIEPLTKGPKYGNLAVDANNLSVLKFTTLNGKSVIGGDLTPGSADNGIFPYQKAAVSKANKGTFLTGINLDFTNSLDLSGTDKLLTFGYYSTRSKYRVGTGLGEDGSSVAVYDVNGNYKLWLFDSADSETDPTGGALSFTLDLSSTSVLESSGTLDLSTIKGFQFQERGRTLNAYYALSRLFLVGKNKFLGGTQNLKMDLNSYKKFERGSYLKLLSIQGSNYQFRVPLSFGDGSQDIYFYEEKKTIEFPKKYDFGKRNLSSHMLDNVLGITFDLTSNSDVKFKTITIQSDKKFHFKSLNSNGTLEFHYLTLRGAGDVSITNNMVFRNSTFDNCDVLNTNAPNIQDSFIINQNGNYGVRISDSTNFTKNKILGYSGKTAIFIPSSVSNITFTDVEVDHSGTDIFWEGSSGTLTVNLSGTSNISSHSSNGGTITINNTRHLKLTGLNDNTEVRVYRKSDLVEIMGIENTSGGEFNGSYNYTQDLDVIITIVSLGHENQRFEYTLTNQDITLPISQVVDRNYSNPA